MDQRDTNEQNAAECRKGAAIHAAPVRAETDGAARAGTGETKAMSTKVTEQQTSDLYRAHAIIRWAAARARKFIRAQRSDRTRFD